ncbi:MAG: phosphatidate cytidylyltransferase [Acidobacteria bacterium]|nr:phosphatidate cytidylyltransferase [Acidobacteriota bacterium]
MSWTEALQDPVFLRYGEFLAALLGLAGLILAVLRWGFDRNVTSVWTTYRGWLLMAPLALGCLAAGRVPTILGLALLAASGIKELARATGLYRDWWMMSAVYAGLAAVTTVCLVQDPRTGTAGWYGMFMALPAYVTALLLAVPVVRNRSKGQLQRICLGILAFLYLGWMFGHLLFLANAGPGRSYLLFLLTAVVLTDVSAFTFGRLLGGRLFGGRRLRPRVSPNKTWAGALGAFLVAMTLPWLLSFSLPGFGPLEKVLTGLIVGIGAQIGDLTVSVIKRDLGIKDMGAALEGHGGVLDRIDSLIFTAPFFFHMVRWFLTLEQG